MDTGSAKPLQVIKFDFPESPTKHGWELIEGSEQDLLPYTKDPDHGRILQIKAEQDFCMDYHVGMLQRVCKAIGFVVRSESDFAFYAEIKVRSQQGVMPGSKLLYCHVIEGSNPEQHLEYPNEYEVHVPVDRLENGWVLMKIDLLQKGREAAAVRGENWEFDRLLMLRLKGSGGIEIDCARIELFEENPWERTVSIGVLSEPVRQQTCVNCHFLVKNIRVGNSCRPLEVTTKNREDIRKQDYSWLKASTGEDLPYSLACYRGIWDEGYNFGSKSRHEVIVQTDRENSCFFWEYRPGVLLPTAMELQKREVHIQMHSCEGADVGAEDDLGHQAVPQPLAGAERPAPAVPVSPPIRQLANLIRARRKAGDQPYTLLLGSSLSLTPEVRQAACEAMCVSDDWEAFWTAFRDRSPTERRTLLASPLDGLNLTAGYRCLAQLVQAGYFDLVLTLNVDDALDKALHILTPGEYRIFTHGEVPGTEIAAALGRTHPRVKVVKLRGDINAYKLPLTPEGQFEFPNALENAVEQLLSQDMTLVGDVSYDTDIQRCIRQGEGALWVIVTEQPQPGSFLYNAKRARPKGEIINGPEAEFVSFFSALARELGMEGPKTSMPSPEGRKLIEFTFTPPKPGDYQNWLSAFRRITEQHRAKGSWRDNNEAEHEINRLEDFVKPFCKGQMYDASFALYSKDADGNFYEEVIVIVKVKPERDLSFEVTDRTQAQKREELANIIRQEIGDLKGVGLISLETV